MIVKYTKERGYQGSGKDPHFTLGHAYILLGIGFNEWGKPAQYTMRSDCDGIPSLVDANCFDLLDSEVNQDWILTNHKNGFFSLRPKEFTGSFWDEYHDGDPAAEKLFEDVYARLKQNYPGFV